MIEVGDLVKLTKGLWGIGLDTGSTGIVTAINTPPGPSYEVKFFQMPETTYFVFAHELEKAG